MQTPREQFLLFRIRASKDEDAFAELYREHDKALRRYLAVKLPRSEDVDDALSETSFRFWNYLTVAEVDSVSGVLFGIARNIVADFYRSRKGEMVEIDGYEPGSNPDSVCNDAEIALTKQAMMELSEQDQQLIVLRHFEGKSSREIAHILQKTEGSVNVMLHRAIKRLRERIQ